MQTTTLPDDLKLSPVKDFFLFDYRNEQDLYKSKISLSMNTISFLQTGIKEVTAGEKTERIDHNSFLIMKAGNCLMTEKISEAARIYRSTLFFFTDAAVLAFLEKNQLYTPLPKKEQSFFSFAYDTFTQHFAEGLLSLKELPAQTKHRLLRLKFEELMLWLSHKHGSDFLNSLIRQTDNKVSRLSNVAESNKYNKLSLDELAFLCSMSVSTFKRAFVKQYEETPMKWFQRQRMEHVSRLLQTGQKRPIDLYETAGYENFSNFVQAFKKMFGQTPKQWQDRREFG